MLKQPLLVRGTRSFRKEQQGAALIEFAISIMLVLTVLFTTFELCSAVYARAVIADAAIEGVRYAVVHSTDSAGAVSQVKTIAAASLHDVSKIAVSVTYPDGSAVPPNRVAVSVTYQYVPYLKIIANPPTWSAYAEGRLVY